MEQKENKPFYKKWWFITIAVIMLLGIFNNPTPPTQPSKEETKTVKTETQATEKVSAVSKEEAQKEFDKLMDMAKKSGLVTSYEIGENKEFKIFVGKIWYTQTVQFKKDFIAKMSSLEQTIYGRHRLEVLDGYSNEKVAEVTAFSGSLEVYK